MRTRLLFLLAAAAATIGLAPFARAQNASGYQVIVHPEEKVTEVDRKFLADVFLKKTTRWSDGDPIRPVDREPDAAPRRKFTQDVIGRTVPAVKSYWQQVIFSGRDVPPPELDADEKVVNYVREHPGAIGYVSSAADVRDVKVVAVK